MAFVPLPSPEEIVRLYSTGELGAEVARHHETAADGEEPFIELCIALHNKADIDLLAVVNTPAFAAIEGHRFFIAQHLYCEAIPKLRADVRALMACCRTLIKQAGSDGAAGQPNLAFQQWCAVHADEALAVVGQAREGDELAKEFLTFALRALGDVDTAVAFVDTFDDDRRLSAMTALAGMPYADRAEAHRIVAILERFVVAGQDDSVRLNALSSAFEILKAHPDAVVAGRLVQAVTKNAGPLTLHALARLVWLHHKLLDDESLETVLHALRAVRAENLGTINLIDMGLRHLFGTPQEAAALDFLTEKLRDGDLTIANFDSVAHELTNEGRQRLYELIVRWFLSGSSALCRNVSDLVGLDNKRAFDTSVQPLGLTPEQQIFLCRKAIGYLFLKPVICCSIIVSVLRAGDRDVVDPVTELLFDPMLVSYGGEAKEYLKGIPASDAAYVPIQAALAKDEAFYAGLNAAGTIKELQPSEYQRDVVGQRIHDEMRSAHKLAESKSVLLNLVHRSTILYGKRSLTYVTDHGGGRRPVAMDLKSFSTSFEMPRRDVLDPVSLDYLLRVFRGEQLR